MSEPENDAGLESNIKKAIIYIAKIDPAKIDEYLFEGVDLRYGFSLVIDGECVDNTILGGSNPDESICTMYGVAMGMKLKDRKISDYEIINGKCYRSKHTCIKPDPHPVGIVDLDPVSEACLKIFKDNLESELHR